MVWKSTISLPDSLFDSRQHQAKASHSSRDFIVPIALVDAEIVQLAKAHDQGNNLRDRHCSEGTLEDAPPVGENAKGTLDVDANLE